MSNDAITWAWRQRAGGASNKLVLVTLAALADDSGCGVAGAQSVSVLAELNRKTVRKAFAELAWRGLVSWKEPLPAGWRYWLLDAPCGEFAAEAPRRKKRIPNYLRWLVFTRDGFGCLRCGSRKDLCADHVVPESAGGPTELNNLQTLCRPCNAAKGIKHEDYRNG